MKSENEFMEEKKEDRSSSDSFSKPRDSAQQNTHSKKEARITQRNSLYALFHIGANTVLFLLILAFGLVYCIRIIHDDYFVTVLERARRTDDDLVDEYTYYDRHCNLADISATKEEASHLIIGTDSNEAIDKMMTHGAIMIPKVLPDSIIHELRDFIVWKNDDVRGTAAEYPVTNGEHRISYGIEATEHPTVVRALKAIHDNDQLKEILEGLVGKDPALTEITAITAEYRSSHQSWHPDVKPDGNGVQFGRTYSHSYSLFIPLQNTTGRMGATDLCPGTHYCTNWIDQQCEQAKIGLHEIHEDGIWRAGDGFLLNQQVWHRGTKHTDMHSGDRIVFIMSFIGRPTDNRQLARGTYFHMKWNMWGHTWQDLADAATSMAYPYNILRCLHLWKAKGRAWGYDLFTSATLRIANNQLGCEPQELEMFLNVLDAWHFPAFLDGTIDLDDDEAWEIYFEETIANIFNFLLAVNIFAIIIYLLVLRGRHVDKINEGSFFASGATRICITHGIVLGMVLFISQRIHNSAWAIGISSDRTLMRPFAKAESVWRDDDPTVSKGRSTVPMRYDVLVGTRLDSRSIGVYSRWHDFHPGNRRFYEFVSNFGGKFYRSYEDDHPNVFSQLMITSAMKVNEQEDGQFLQQDFRTGDWYLMTEFETRRYIRLQLFLGTNNLLSSLKKEIDFIMGNYRFGALRGTAMSMLSQSFMQEMTNNLFKVRSEKEMTKTSLPLFMNMSSARVKPLVKSQNSKSQYLEGRDRIIHPLAEVLYLSQRASGPKKVPATVLQLSDNGEAAEISFYDAYYFGVTKWVPTNYLLPRVRPIEGLPVRCNYLEKGDLFLGHIEHVLPTAAVDILYEDGDHEYGALVENYEILS